MDFWAEFMKIEQQVVFNLRLDTDEGKDMAMRGLELIGRMSGYPLVFQVGINIRNGKKLPERKDTLELVVSPNWDRKKVALVEKIYDAWASLPTCIPSYWTVVKYQPFLPCSIYSMDIGGVTHEDFEYCIQFNYAGADVWVGILVFLKMELAAELLTKASEAAGPNPTWFLDTKKKNGRAPLIFLNSAVGEYNMITRIKAVEFIPADSHPTIPRYSLLDLHKEFEKIDKQKYSNKPGANVEECVRCGHYSYQTKLIKCSVCDIYYCDSVCMKADAENHSYVCRA